MPADASAFDEAQIDFVDERGRLEAVPEVLSRHLATSNPMQLVVDDRDQPVECRVIALSPCNEESRDVRRGCRDGGILTVVHDERHDMDDRRLTSLRRAAIISA